MEQVFTLGWTRWKAPKVIVEPPGLAEVRSGDQPWSEGASGGKSDSAEARSSEGVTLAQLWSWGLECHQAELQPARGGERSQCLGSSLHRQLPPVRLIPSRQKEGKLAESGRTDQPSWACSGWGKAGKWKVAGMIVCTFQGHRMLLGQRLSGSCPWRDEKMKSRIVQISGHV